MSEARRAGAARRASVDHEHDQVPRLPAAVVADMERERNANSVMLRGVDPNLDANPDANS
ncbi:hypothetical protein [Mycobacteroides abscessus]|uniref:hypothetical protein n=1 Tax=Mycobacteroides abscessus TaxID=36809 RepID=UPI0009A652BD|nr:hypothetical protein [Mycobacteroides abscessus]SLF07193.1 Uncharacterised protein [Mycobacteroides abscessus subsp. abscessus]